MHEEQAVRRGLIEKEKKLTNMLFQRLALTNIGHLSHTRIVRAVKELWRIVVDVLHLDNEL